VPLIPEADFEYDFAAVDIRCRASTLQSWNAQLFRNASIKGLPEEISHGYIQSYAFGAARLFRIGAAHAVIMHRAGGARAPVTLLLQLNGQSTARQSQRECHLKGADFTFVDSSVPFEFEASGDHELILVQMPRSVVFSRHPNIRDI
ncbi:hypothetical protein, partial [Lactobacillus crispatus]|uniref:AraC-like ligand-binding domain-containing protein n=1 Tax=Lactobacillus crispatus TaxID=47770 RepID=UPI00105DE4F8